MKRKLLIAISCIAILFISFLLLGNADFKQSQIVVVHASIYDLAPKFTDIKNWSHWYTTAGNNNLKIPYTIRQLNAASVKIERIKNGNTFNELITAVPSKDEGSTMVQWASEINGFAWLAQKIAGKSGIKNHSSA